VVTECQRVSDLSDALEIRRGHGALHVQRSAARQRQHPIACRAGGTAGVEPNQHASGHDPEILRLARRGQQGAD
jgi:hypothetical protein